MAGATALTFDAAGSNADGTNPGTALAVLENASYKTLLEGVSWPAPQPTVQWATSVDTEGSVPASTKHENRQINLTILCKSAQALSDLEGKAGKIQRERGTLSWTNPGGKTIMFDLLSVDQFEPVFDDGLYVASGGTYCKVLLQFTALPYGREAEQDLGDNVETTLPILIFTDTGVRGDWYGLGRLVIDEDQAQAQSTILWGIQSRYYDSASTAALFYQAESLTITVGSAAAGPAGASGAGSNTVFNGSLTNDAPDVLYMFSSTFTFTGSFRVFARVQAPNTNTGTVYCGVKYTVRGGAPVILDNVALDPSYEASWRLVDLGQITVSPAPTGSQGVEILFGSSSTVTNDDIYWDYVFFVPVDEGSGVASMTSPSGITPINASSQALLTSSAMLKATTGSMWTKPGKYEGDYLLIPPAGLESRTVRTLLKMSRGDIVDGTDAGTGTADAGIDDLSAHLYVTPRYLVVPSP